LEFEASGVGFDSRAVIDLRSFVKLLHSFSDVTHPIVWFQNVNSQNRDFCQRRFNAILLTHLHKFSIEVEAETKSDPGAQFLG